MLNFVELGSNHLPLIHFVPKCVLSYFQEKLVGFDRKENFRNKFKKLNEAPKKCRKQGEEAHGRAPGSTAVLLRQGPRMASRASWHDRFFCGYLGFSFIFLGTARLLWRAL